MGQNVFKKCLGILIFFVLQKNLWKWTGEGIMRFKYTLTLFVYLANFQQCGWSYNIYSEDVYADYELLMHTCTLIHFG